MKEIRWNKGSGTFIATLCITLMAMALVFMYLAFTDSMYAGVISRTRSDAIADSTAVFAESYDYKFNQAQAAIMVELLTDYTNNALDGDKYEITSNLTFPTGASSNSRAVDSLRIDVIAKIARIFPSVTGENAYAGYSTTVTSVDIYGDTFVVGIDDNRPDDQNQAPPGVADATP